MKNCNKYIEGLASNGFEPVRTDDGIGLMIPKGVVALMVVTSNKTVAKRMRAEIAKRAGISVHELPYMEFDREDGKGFIVLVKNTHHMRLISYSSAHVSNDKMKHWLTVIPYGEGISVCGNNEQSLIWRNQSLSTLSVDTLPALLCINDINGLVECLYKACENEGMDTMLELLILAMNDFAKEGKDLNTWDNRQKLLESLMKSSRLKFTTKAGRILTSDVLEEFAELERSLS